jgi:hypothetical protein
MHRVPVTSTNLAAVGYDGIARVLEVEFLDGRVYQYFDVPMHVYHDLLTSDAPGVYLDTHVKKPGYRYKRIA